MRQVKSNITVLFLLIFNLIMYKWRSTIVIFQIFNNSIYYQLIISVIHSKR